MPEGMDWIIILVVLVVCFGGSQIPKLARSLGQAQKEFKSGLAEGAADDPVPSHTVSSEPVPTDAKQPDPSA